ncbi:glycosyltransferase family 4 protein [Adhaeribacter aquaticus]|uniref:glycosyltransferase family 4 protein n=1 Tax=Adhaeribacter aquaticus TaxID=299567 RepID=UPI0004106F0E|nr:glycosyltransferase family 4 protein [Adhaeribacter aquaticus]
MKLIFTHPTGNANVRAAACGLNEAGLLQEFRTSIASFPGSILDSLGSLGPLSEIRRRGFDASLKEKTRSWPWLEAGRLIASKAGFANLIKHETGPLSVDKVYQNFDYKTASDLKSSKKKGINAVYAYEDGAYQTFQEAKRLQLTCLYDLPIGYWRAAQRLLNEESLRKPEWASTMTGLQDSDEKLTRKDEELRLADRIFVASQFTAKTLKDFPSTLAPIQVIPYGFPSVAQNREYSLFSRRRLKLLFVGGLSQRKGIADLFAAVEALGNFVELTVVGRKTTNNCAALDAALAKHNWIPSLPHADILKLMQNQDVFVFPSLFEGFGLVITEAMSQGTPVITTERTAGPDIIHHNENGWLIEAGSQNALQETIEKLISQPKAVVEAGKAALETAKKRPWEVYGQELAAAILKNN